MFEICETNPFDSLSKSVDQHEGKTHTYSRKFLTLFFFVVLVWDSDDDFELV
jgi:hypothetical protein